MSKVGLWIFAWALLGLELGLRGTLRLWSSEVSPGLVLVLMVFIAMCAAPSTAAWWALGLGTLVDLTTPMALKTSGPPGVIVGPHAIAFLLGAHLVLALRGVMIRRNPLTLGFLSLSASVVTNVAVVAVLWVRTLFDPVIFEARGELVSRLGASLYTGLAGVALAFVLLPLAEFVGLPSQTRRQFGRT